VRISQNIGHVDTIIKFIPSVLNVSVSACKYYKVFRKTNASTHGLSNFNSISLPTLPLARTCWGKKKAKDCVQQPLQSFQLHVSWVKVRGKRLATFFNLHEICFCIPGFCHLIFKKFLYFSLINIWWNIWFV
jgi:hypothetical protein